MGLLTLLFPIFLALILIVVLFGIIYLIKRREGEIKEERKTLREKIQSIQQDVDEFLDTETLEETMEEILEESFNFPCFIPPTDNGTCGRRYRLETDEDTGKKCCYPEDAIQPSKFQNNLKLANQIIQEILFSMLVFGILKRIIRLGGASKAASTAAVKAAKTAKAIKAYKAARAVKVARSGRAASIAIRGAVRGTASLSKAVASGGLLLAVDAAFMTMDILDTEGYASFIPQSQFISTKNMIDYQSWEAMQQADMEHPMLYPLLELYGESYELATELGYGKLIEKYFESDMELEKNSEYKKAFDDYVDAMIDSIVNETDEPKFPTKLEEYAMKIPEDHYIERDELVYDAMKNLIPLADVVSNTKLYPKISSPYTIGITLSEQGANRMNEKNKEDWLTNDESEKLVAVYTDKYNVYKSGDATNPVMEEKTLGEKTVLATSYGLLFSSCEKRRQTRSEAGSVTPTSFGSYYDFKNSKCIFTNELCKKYGLKWKSDKNDCEEYEGQKEAEILFGPTMTRGAIKYGNAKFGQAFESGDPIEILAAIGSIVQDPFNINQNFSGSSQASGWGMGF
tara:strand:- start:11926 stop:13635 length:1710 start_codon:yes stop_codon:yes gene_type:complete